MSDHGNQHAKSGVHTRHFALLLVGGLCLGLGLVNLVFSFGWPGGGFNSNFSLIGWTGLDDITMLGRSNASIPLVVVGALCLVIANATAWKETNGY